MTISSAIDKPTLNIRNKRKQTKVLDVLSGYVLDKGDQENIRKLFQEEMNLGLSAKPRRTPSLCMENTFVEEGLNGTEEGHYLALDLGGTNLRVLHLELKCGKIIDQDIEVYDVPEDIRVGPGTDLFDYLAGCIEDFWVKKDLPDEEFKLGFTFSFSIGMKAVDSGILNCWSKSYKCPGVVGSDIVKMLRDAIAKRGRLNISVNSLINDATGTLIKGSYLDRECAIGIILGTGHNICYLEKVPNIKKWKGRHSEKKVIVCTECGAFGDNGVLDFMRTEWDDVIDNKCINKKINTFEKLFAGRYLGDLVRETLVGLADRGLFCSGPSPQLKTNHSLKSSTVSRIELDTLTGKRNHTERALVELGLDYTNEDIKILQYVCAIVSYRGALLVSLLTSVLINRVDLPHCTVAVDGSLYEKHPRFKSLMEHLISQNVKGKSFNLLLAKDGSGKGAGLVAAVEDRLSQRHSKH